MNDTTSQSNANGVASTGWFDSVRPRPRAKCSDCRAYSCNAGRYTCAMGYEMRKERHTHYTICRPAEPCPKPTTVKALVYAPKKWELSNDTDDPAAKRLGSG